jgi:hypothetical protein
MSAEPLGRAGKRALPILCLGLAALGLLVSGCGTKNRVTFPDAVLSFIPESVVTRGISLQSGDRSANDFLEVEVAITDLGDVASIEYQLDYPADLFMWVDAREGTYLSEDGSVDTELQADQAVAGNIGVRHTRAAGSGPFEPEFAFGVLVGVGFQGIGSGEGTFAVRSIRAQRSDGSEIEGLTDFEARVIINLANAS